MAKRYSRLELKLPSTLKMMDFSFKFIVKNSSTDKVVYVEKGKFDGGGFTKWFEIMQVNRTLYYEIYQKNRQTNKEIKVQTILAKTYEKQNNWSLYAYKVSSGTTKKEKENIKEIYLNNGEVAWYLIKNREFATSWARKVYKNQLTAKDWEILKQNNPHIPQFDSKATLTPGQVIILSNSTTAKELPEYKKLAKEAHKNLEKMVYGEGVDAQFFAQNYEFFCDAISDKRTDVTTRNVFNTDHPLVYKFKQENDSRTAMDVLKDNTGAWDVTKTGVDAILAFSTGSAQRMTAIHGKLALKMAEERAKKSGLDNPKNFKLFRQKYKDLYAELDKESMKRMFRWDQSIKTNNMRRMINQSALARGKTYKGGMLEYTKQMSEVGKMAKSVKVGGYLLLPLEAYFAYDAVQNAAPEEKTRTAVVEGSKLAGGAGGAALGTLLVLTVASGGTALAVVGLVAGASAIVGWAGGVIGGEIGGAIYDEVESLRK